jgi:protein-S-isoprenylcysteine O-methyltransferase Ste14
MGWILFGLWEVFWIIWAISALITVPKNERIHNILIQLLGVVIIVPLISLMIWAEITKFAQLPLHLQGNIVNVSIGFFLTVVGLSFAVWSRIKLSRNWSGEVRLLPNQKLVRDGPYRVVRNPIYTGQILGILGTAVALLDVISCLVFLVVVFTLVQKSKDEEELLVKQFGIEYEQYKKEVKMLIPFLF